MKDLNQVNIKEIFFSNIEEAKNYLNQYGNSGHDKNSGVSLSYDHIAKNDPLFIWFSAATIGSIQVGKTIDLVNNPVLNHCESTNNLSLGFAYGNQKIHNNVVSLYYIYKDYGIKGLYKLKESDPDSIYISFEAIKSFEHYTDIQNQAKQYAVINNLNPNDMATIKHILSQQENVELLKISSMLLMQHEQNIVQPMYEMSFYLDEKTLGQTLNDTNFIEKLIANKIELSGAKILDKYISTDSYDFSNYEQRVAYFDKVFDEYFDVLSQEGGYDLLINQRESMIASLDANFIAYGDHFQDSTNNIALTEMNMEDILSSKFAFVWDDNSHEWRAPSSADATIPSDGIWVSATSYPDVMKVVDQFPLIDKTFYYDSVNNQSYIFCSESFLPNLSPNYMWVSLITYLQPSPTGYQNGGAIWTMEQINKNAANNTQDQNKLILSEIIDSMDDSLQTLLDSLNVPKSQPEPEHINATDNSALSLALIAAPLASFQPILQQNQIPTFVLEIA
ncbi:MAG: hypothetical protein JSR17_12695 [Proteobacteria bacterium]|nr:hypothetical protein [Pseudomonadota bacterium]